MSSVLLLKHPKERKQKHQSAWILERCLAGIQEHVTRRLSPAGPPAGIEFLYESPQSCLLVFPGPNAQPLSEILDADVKHLVFVDATWRFAREMVKSSEPLAALRCATLSPPPGTDPVFVVRKPLLLEPTGDSQTDPEQRWGYSTAEAVALAMDEVRALRDPGSTESEAWPVVGTALGAYARHQLERTAAPRVRENRPGFIPGLYDKVKGRGDETEAATGESHMSEVSGEAENASASNHAAPKAETE